MMCFLCIFLSFNYYLKIFSVTHVVLKTYFWLSTQICGTRGSHKASVSHFPSLQPLTLFLKCLWAIYLHAILEDVTLRTFMLYLIAPTHTQGLHQFYLHSALSSYSCILNLQGKCLWFSEILSLPLFRGHFCISEIPFILMYMYLLISDFPINVQSLS